MQTRWPVREMPTSVADMDLTTQDVTLTPGLAVVQEQILVALKRRRRVALVGGPGSGRTSVLQSVHRTLLQNGSAVDMVRPGGSPPGRSHVVLADDAERLDDRAWSNLIARPGAWVVAGLPSMQTALAGLRRVTVIRIPALSPGEVFGFTISNLRQHGEAAGLVSDLAVARLGVVSGGVPGRLVTILRLAIFLARLEEATLVEPRHVEQAVALGDDDGPKDEPSMSPTPMVRAARARDGWAVRLVTLGLAGAVVLQPGRLNGPDAGPVLASAPVPQAPSPVLAMPAASFTPPPAFQLPDATPLHIVLLVAGGNAVAQAQGRVLQQTLRARGYDVADPQPVQTSQAASELRYYFTDDAESATVLAQAASIQPGSIRLATPARGVQPRPGMIEIITGSSVPGNKPT